MKKNPIIRWISGMGLLLAGAFVALSATSAAGAPSEPGYGAEPDFAGRSAIVDPGVTPAREDDSTVVASRSRCDEVSIRSCSTSCSHSCRRGPYFSGCAATCERTCRSRFCR